MALVSAAQMLKDARDGKYAIGAFNTNNLEWTIAILKAAEEKKSPVMIQTSMGAAKYMGGYKVCYAIVSNLIDTLGITVPVALHLDHGSSVEVCKEYIDAGFSSVMYDHSHFPIDENIEETKKVVEYAHGKGASVEAEVGTVGGTEDGVTGGINYADLNECKRMVEEAGIDALAAALGSVHGTYEGEPVLGFDEMLAISEATNAPLVLHGGSGIPEFQIKKAIERGHAKINVNTELQQVWTAAVREKLATDPKVYDPRKVIAPGKAAIVATTKATMDIFGSTNKA